MKITAKFKGTDSLGYQHGHIYALIIYKDYIKREDGEGVCRYSNLEAFFKNWEIFHLT